MATKHYSKNRDGSTTTTTRYNTGSSKSVTRKGGSVLSSGKITRITTSDKWGNSRTRKY